jgi:hypothetical protein
MLVEDHEVSLFMWFLLKVNLFLYITTTIKSRLYPPSPPTSCSTHPFSILTHPIKSFNSLAKLSYLVILFLHKFGGENMSWAPLDLGMLENHLVGGNSLGIQKL